MQIAEHIAEKKGKRESYVSIESGHIQAYREKPS